MLASNLWALTVSVFFIYRFGQGVESMWVEIIQKLPFTF